MGFRWLSPNSLVLALVCLGLAGCRSITRSPIAVDQRQGEEIIVAGRYFSVGTPVVTWRDPGGFNGYAAPMGMVSDGPRDSFGIRRAPGVKTDPARPPDFATLRRRVDQLILHYDACGLSRICFEKLQERSLSAHFLIDVDGTIYQTLDARERAYHATIANSRSIGVEMANIGAYPPEDPAELDRWYTRDALGARLDPPPEAEPLPTGLDAAAVRPARPGLIEGRVHGKTLVQYDYTPAQYRALAQLATALHQIFPRLRIAVPRDTDGQVEAGVLTPSAYEAFCGILGHSHVQANKVDPGPAFDWEKLLRMIRSLEYPRGHK